MQPPARPPDTGRQPAWPQQGAQNGVFGQYPEEEQRHDPGQPGPQQAGLLAQDAPYIESGAAQGEDFTPQDQAASRVPKFLLAILVIAALVLLLRYQVFTIRHVVVSGNRLVSIQEVARAAGADRGLFYFTVNEDAIRRGINANRYLVFERMEKIIPNKLHLIVRERRPFAFFTHLGVGYVLAQDGIILEQTRELKDGSGLMHINGLAVWGQQAPGALPASTDPAQAETLLNLLHELELWGFEAQVVSVDIAQSLNLSLHTRDGYAINLGDNTQLHAKIGTVASVVNELRRQGMSGGIIEAARPGEATYRAQQ